MSAARCQHTVRTRSSFMLSAAALVLQVIAENHNVCNQLHMPAQSGASTTLQRMRRGYTREAYDALVQHARNVIPGVALSTDIITGESESSHTQQQRRSSHLPAYLVDVLNVCRCQSVADERCDNPAPGLCRVLCGD